MAPNSLPALSVQGVRGSALQTELKNLLMQSTRALVESSSSPARGQGEGSGYSVWIVLLGGGNFTVQTVTQSCSRSSSLEGSFRTSEELGAAGRCYEPRTPEVMQKHGQEEGGCRREVGESL